jgi:hypothetical protein
VNTSANRLDSGTLQSTPILDYHKRSISELSSKLRSEKTNDREFVQAAHQSVSRLVKPIYTLKELQPASRTLQKQKGSCSQRMACLEAIARAGGVATRVRALQVSGKFWDPRFPIAHAFIPDSVLLVWPQFSLNGTWVDVDELYSSARELAKVAEVGFSNLEESVFDAIDHVPVDFFGKTCAVGCSTRFDLSRFLLADNGFFGTRDEAFERFGYLYTTFRGRTFEILYGGRKSI